MVLGDLLKSGTFISNVCSIHSVLSDIQSEDEGILLRDGSNSYAFHYECTEALLSWPKAFLGRSLDLILWLLSPVWKPKWSLSQLDGNSSRHVAWLQLVCVQSWDSFVITYLEILLPPFSGDFWVHDWILKTIPWHALVELALVWLAVGHMAGLHYPLFVQR